MENTIIKFRALKDDMSNCDFVYGDLVYQAGVPMIKDNAIAMLFHTCLKGTEGQFTGYYDKHNKEIYVGDQMYIPGYHCEVVFKDGAFMSIYKHPEDGEEQLLAELGTETFTIVGNIHSNT